MGDVDFLEAKVAGLEAEVRRLKQSFWDKAFLAALSGCVSEWADAGVGVAEGIANEAERVRNARVAS